MLQEKLKDLLKKINDKYAKKTKDDKPVIFIASEHPELITPVFIPTGIPQVDDVLGGGIPSGVVVGVHGQPWGGKTSFCLTLAAQLTKEKKYVLYVNLESIPLETYAQFIDIDLNYVVQLSPRSSAEETIKEIEDLVFENDKPTDVFSLIIIDSLNNLYTLAEDKAQIAGPDKVAQMASRAKLIDMFLTRFYGKGVGRNGLTIMAIVQDRANIAGASMPMAPKTIISCGESLKFNAKVMLKISRKINQANTGQTVTMKVEKNSMLGCLGTAEFGVIYKMGLDDTQTLIDKAKEFNYISSSKKDGTFLHLPGLGDLEIVPIKANKALGITAVSAVNMLGNIIRSRPEVAQCLRSIFSEKKPPMGAPIGYPYIIEEAEESGIEENE